MSIEAKPRASGPFAGTSIDRRTLLARAACVGGAVATSRFLCSTPAEAATLTTFKATHGTGLCNCPFFMVKETGRPTASRSTSS